MPTPILTLTGEILDYSTEDGGIAEIIEIDNPAIRPDSPGIFIKVQSLDHACHHAELREFYKKARGRRLTVLILAEAE